MQVEKGNALGWKDAGKNGSKERCLDYIKHVWTDMRPLSLRQKMAKSVRPMKAPKGSSSRLKVDEKVP
jgi:hypothetical protein